MSEVISAARTWIQGLCGLYLSVKSVVVCVDALVVARWVWALGLVAARVCSTRVPRRVAGGFVGPVFQ